MGVGLVTAVAMGAGASASLADTVHVPYPPNQQACGGLVLAATNNQSGSIGASGNTSASAGPGYFFGPGTPYAIAGGREFCSA
jgi:hypothetical protein